MSVRSKELTDDEAMQVMGEQLFKIYHNDPRTVIRLEDDSGEKIKIRIFKIVDEDTA